MGTAARVERTALLAPGTRLGRYHLLERLAIGGMAELHVACAEGLAGFQKVVVVKRVLPGLAQDDDFIAMFLNEARLAAGLDHPNLVQVMDIGQEEGEYFYVMEYVHGQNVRAILGEASKRGGMPLEVALAIVMAVATGLHHAHERVDLEGRALGLVHRDVSPANVLVSYDGAVKVTDFGIAKASARTTETIGGAMKGKIGYMSPEQCRGEAVDRRSDVFALGILLAELTTMQRLFWAENDFAILNKVLRGEFDPPSRTMPGYPEALEAIVMRALAADREARHPTAGALLRDLEAFAHDAHLRCTTAIVADFMRMVFGSPAYPRVEVLPARPEDPLEGMPTLVLAGDSMRGADPDALTRYEPPLPTLIFTSTLSAVDREPPRSRMGTLLGAAALVIVAGVGVGWWISEREPTQAPPRAVEVAQPSAGPAESPSEVVPPAMRDEPEPEPEPEPREAEAPTAEGAASPASPKKTGPSRKRRTKAKPKGAGDIDALYPVKG